ncbi:MAG: hypothetical protein FWG33_00190 [Oscillospiraceae bacterium]|nr:hypothetical protein [Oscillospiraceae bacterium]
MKNEEKILSILESMQNEMTDMRKQMKSMDGRMDSMDRRMDSMQSEMTDMHESISVIEVEHGKKLGALFDAIPYMKEFLKKLINSQIRLTG